MTELQEVVPVSCGPQPGADSFCKPEESKESETSAGSVVKGGFWVVFPLRQQNTSGAVPNRAQCGNSGLPRPAARPYGTEQEVDSSPYCNSVLHLMDHRYL